MCEGGRERVREKEYFSCSVFLSIDFELCFCSEKGTRHDKSLSQTEGNKYFPQRGSWSIFFPGSSIILQRVLFFIFPVRALTGQAPSQALGLLSARSSPSLTLGVEVGANNWASDHHPVNQSWHRYRENERPAAAMDCIQEEVPWPWCCFYHFLSAPCVTSIRIPFGWWWVVGSSEIKPRQEDEGFLQRLKQAQHKLQGAVVIYPCF